MGRAVCFDGEIFPQRCPQVMIDASVSQPAHGCQTAHPIGIKAGAPLAGVPYAMPHPQGPPTVVMPADVPGYPWAASIVLYSLKDPRLRGGDSLIWSVAACCRESSASKRLGLPGAHSKSPSPLPRKHLRTRRQHPQFCATTWTPCLCARVLAAGVTESDRPSRRPG